MALGVLMYVLLKPQSLYYRKNMTSFYRFAWGLAVLSQRSEKRLLASSCFLGPSVCPNGTTWLSLDGFL
jgi:hypothetical protein